MSDIGVEQFAALDFTPEVRGFLHRPAHPDGRGLVLTHGAGSNCQTDLLRSLAEAFAGAGFTVLRVNLPFRQRRVSGPPRRGDAELDRLGLKNAVEALKKIGPNRLFLGGHSYGGRQATLLCASEASLVSALLLLSYPLHPPGKANQMRTQHFPSLHTPALFVHGSRDGFGSVDEMQSALRLIPAKTQLLHVDGAGHDLSSKTPDLVKTVVSAFQTLI